MTALDWALYLGSALLTAIGLTLIKLDLAAPLPAELAWLARFTLALAIYVVGMGLWLLAMGRNALSTAYPIGIGLSLASATLAAMLALGEPVGPARLAGIGLIVLGAVCVSRSAHQQP